MHAFLIVMNFHQTYSTRRSPFGLPLHILQRGWSREVFTGSLPPLLMGLFLQGFSSFCCFSWESGQVLPSPAAEHVVFLVQAICCNQESTMCNYLYQRNFTLSPCFCLLPLTTSPILPCWLYTPPNLIASDSIP